MNKPPEITKAHEIIESWAKDPEKFIIEALRFEQKTGPDGTPNKLTTQQRDALKKIRLLVWSKIKSGTGGKLTEEETMYAKKMGVSIRSGKGTGKDCMGAMLVLWFLVCFPNVKIPCTANSGKQLKEVLWSEIKKWLKDSLIEDWVVCQSDKVYMKAGKKEDHGKRWFATARTVNVKGSADAQSETLQGFHEDYMMFVVDEASGLPEPVFKPFETTLTGLCNFVLLLWNPTRSHGYAIDTFGKNKEDWVCLQWNAEESELSQMPQFKAQIERMERRYGRDSTAFRVNVLGLPPKASADALIPMDWVMDAVGREFEIDPDDPLRLGVDVGAGGDRSVLLQRVGNSVTKIKAHDTPDTMELTGWVSDAIHRGGVDATFVDIIGIGQGVYDRLRELGHKRVYSVDVRRTSTSERFKKLRDELWWKIRERFEKGTISIPNDEELICELTTIKYKPESDGRVKVEGKKELRARGAASPDKADALCLTEFLPASIFREAKKDSWDQLLDDAEDERRPGGCMIG